MKYISFSKPNIPVVTVENLKEVMDSGWITTGKKAQLLESSIVKIIGAKYAVAVSSGTAALHLAYLAAGIGQGDEVIVPSYTFCSTINTILHTGAKPVFCDINEDTLCLDLNDIKKRITSKTKAIVVVHFAGMPADMDEINKLARKYNLKVIEDAAHAFLTKYKGKYIGGGKNLTCFSFYATKNLTTAEGGLVICPNLKIANYVRMLSLHGISKNGWKRYHKTGSWKYDVLLPGFKYNLSDIHATIGLSQIPLVDKAHKTRVRLSKLFKKFLSKNPNLILPNEPIHPMSSHAWHLFVIRVKSSSKIKRDELIEKLKLFGIGTSVHFIPNHMQTLYKKLHLSYKLPITEKIFQQILSLPFYEKLNDKEVEYICQTLNQLTYEK
jgi:perosamine synthetase